MKLAACSCEDFNAITLSMTQEIEIGARTIDGRERKMQAKIHEIVGKERTRRALKVLGIFWGLAIACVFVPILHFILVPLFTLVGIWLALRAFRNTREM